MIGKVLCDRRGLPDRFALDMVPATHAGGALSENRTDVPEPIRLCRERIVLMTRDVRDTAVSAYYQATRRVGMLEEPNEFTGSLSDFIRDPRYGAPKITAFERMWWDFRHNVDELYHVTYEALRADTAGVLAGVAEFLGCAFTPEEIATAVEFAGFRAMRRRESEGYFATDALRPGDPADPMSFKVRTGGGDALSAKDESYLAGFRTPWTESGDRYRKHKVLVTVPSGDNWVRTETMQTAMKYLVDPRWQVTVKAPRATPFEANLHEIIEDFMAGDWDFWQQIDSDTWHRRCLLELTRLDKDIIAGPCPVYHNTGNGERPIYQNAYRWIEREGAFTEWPTRRGLQRVDAVGTASMLIARRVFEHPDMRKGAFSRHWSEAGIVEMGNDLAFCRRATASGFEIWCDFDYPVEHMVTVPLHETGSAVLAGSHG